MTLPRLVTFSAAAAIAGLSWHAFERRYGRTQLVDVERPHGIREFVVLASLSRALGREITLDEISPRPIGTWTSAREPGPPATD